MKNCSIIIALLLLLATGACGDSMKNSPQYIDADGREYFACSDTVYISNESSGGLFSGGELTFRVKFTDVKGMSHVIKGIKRLHVSDIPPSSPSCKPQP